MSIEGIPEGWELVGIGTPKLGEHVLGKYGKILHCNGVFKGGSYVVIRKIEKPKQYRPFENEREAEPFWDAKLRYKVSGNSKEPGKAMFRVNCIGEVDVGIAFSVYSYQTAFEIFECIDGTPFGVEVVE